MVCGSPPRISEEEHSPTINPPADSRSTWVYHTFCKETNDAESPMARDMPPVRFVANGSHKDKEKGREGERGREGAKGMHGCGIKSAAQSYICGE